MSNNYKDWVLDTRTLGEVRQVAGVTAGDFFMAKR